MPGAALTYEEFNAQVVFGRMRRRIFIGAWQQKPNTPPPESVATSDLNEQWTVFARGAPLRYLCQRVRTVVKGVSIRRSSGIKTTHATLVTSIATITK